MASQWSPGGGGRPSFLNRERGAHGTPEKGAGPPSCTPIACTLTVDANKKFLTVTHDYLGGQEKYASFTAVMTKATRLGLLSLQVRHCSHAFAHIAC